jgi:hypothetical protein
LGGNEVPGVSAMKKLLTTSNLAMVLCLVGCALLFLPWGSAVIWTLDPTPQADGSYKLKSWPPASESYPGYRFWHATACAVGFLALFLLLLATAPVRPVPRWRSVAILVVGGSVLALVVLGLNTEPAVFRSDMSEGRAVQSTWGASNFVALGLGAGLMVLAALEIRSGIERGSRQPTPAQDIPVGREDAGLSLERPRPTQSSVNGEP